MNKPYHIFVGDEKINFYAYCRYCNAYNQAVTKYGVWFYGKDMNNRVITLRICKECKRQSGIEATFWLSPDQKLIWSKIVASIQGKKKTKIQINEVTNSEVADSV